MVGVVRMARLASEKEAADYIGLEVATFRAWVSSGRLPQPIADCGKYDLKAIDLAIDRICFPIFLSCRMRLASV